MPPRADLPFHHCKSADFTIVTGTERDLWVEGPHIPKGSRIPVVYADGYDELCHIASALAAALQPFADAADYSCTCPDDGHYVCPWHTARRAIKDYADGDR